MLPFSVFYDIRPCVPSTPQQLASDIRGFVIHVSRGNERDGHLKNGKIRLIVTSPNNGDISSVRSGTWHSLNYLDFCFLDQSLTHP